MKFTLLFSQLMSLSDSSQDVFDVITRLIVINIAQLTKLIAHC